MSPLSFYREEAFFILYLGDANSSKPLKSKG